ncbi:hypothetical protein AB1399_12330 [Hydrogenibacillus schlegelii]|uniref:Uncharacterized protein n=1 Tax=Hydrogenibacillus schlegelii TaxID=1484 RepID=A0A132N7J5_HYDSH|nr:hypothetical protein [Hydrogenibacillus schlegelii]KWX06089.1 hypothetical protein TR75_07035 [Hydrogenibacillus schlegelii]MBT9282823.1 hypothetical protein [Hydrogenibacillus schlegelii]OAR03697.1 hypothetical protein SA87_00465 [Hydrogenibacillus schlegelii]PTQ54162.1 MAG: hypothetical protein HSCHL_0806 [Hydrogenibacillus schlegelii]
MPAHERLIQAFFRTVDAAERALGRLRVLGPLEVDIRRLNPFPHDGAVARPANLLSGRIPSLSHLTLGTDHPRPDFAVLEAADPSASGLADGDPSAGGEDVVLIALVPPEHAEAAEAIVRDAGGRL